MARESISLQSILPLYLLLVVAVALTGGALPGILAAVVSDIAVNFYFVPPYGTLHVDSEDNLIAVLVFVLVAVIVSVLVDVAGRRT